MTKGDEPLLEAPGERGRARHAEQAEGMRRRRRRLFVGIGIVVSVLMAIAISRSLGDLRKGRAHEADLKQRIDASSERIDALEQRTEALESDPAAIETLAREELLMARPTDRVVLLPEEPVEEPRQRAESAESPTGNSTEPDSDPSVEETDDPAEGEETG